ncbi:hypothetical protein GCK72_012516 [Caenorhabditis remanei]|uniref:PAN-3 domain-containing protein n=1 Tax=Caenorhabditis remanei TaxID=31234 RepID=A0A6A5GN34_CAERE|nr:hypothetical protein GCK72_012516 [Caenorhabditis remanei]KAF1756063.1 hypothetical protein GCK72_012516 [Caenorhabditis remanei]
MMKIFGQVLTTDLKEVLDSEGNGVPVFECIEECFQIPWCFLAYMIGERQCYFFNFGLIENLTVVETKTEEGLIVAFRTDLLLDQCPAYDNIDLVVTHGPDDIPWTKTGNEFKFKKCVGYWRMFKRENGVVVCIQFFKEDTNSLEGAIQRCHERGGYQLTGVQSKKELQWIFDARISFYTWDKNTGFWINARRQNTGVNDTHFNITDGYTILDQDFYREFADLSGTNAGIPEDCLMVSNASRGFQMIDVPCDNNSYGKGYVCGYPLD